MKGKLHLIFINYLNVIKDSYLESLLTLREVKNTKVYSGNGRVEASIRVRRLKGKIRVYARIRGKERRNLKGQAIHKFRNEFRRDADRFIRALEKGRKAATKLNEIESRIEDFILMSEIYLIRYGIEVPSKANRLEYLASVTSILIEELEEIDTELLKIIRNRHKRIFFARSRTSPIWGILRVDIFLKNRKCTRLAVREKKKIKQLILDEVESSFLSIEKREKYKKHLFATINRVEKLMLKKREVKQCLSCISKLASSLSKKGD